MAEDLFVRFGLADVADSLRLAAACGDGDFPSHIYNAWLATLIEQGKLPGMALAHLKTNVLVDSMLVGSLKRFSVATSEKLVLGASVLIFFWGVFALAYSAKRKQSWSVTPLIAVVTYGVIFQLGFSNFYVATGISCIALALLLGEQTDKGRVAAALALSPWLGKLTRSRSDGLWPHWDMFIFCGDLLKGEFNSLASRVSP